MLPIPYIVIKNKAILLILSISIDDVKPTTIKLVISLILSGPIIEKI